VEIELLRGPADGTVYVVLNPENIQDGECTFLVAQVLDKGKRRVHKYEFFGTYGTEGQLVAFYAGTKPEKEGE